MALAGGGAAITDPDPHPQRLDENELRDFSGLASAMKGDLILSVIPAKAGIQGGRHRSKRPWTPAFAGVTAVGEANISVSNQADGAASH